jgi:hypothetical protein
MNAGVPAVTLPTARSPCATVVTADRVTAGASTDGRLPPASVVVGTRRYPVAPMPAIVPGLATVPTMTTARFASAVPPRRTCTPPRLRIARAA